MSAEKDYIIITDSTCDLPISFYRENNIHVFSIPFTFDGITYTQTDVDLDSKDFYDKLRNGAMPKTAQAGRDDMESTFDSYLAQGLDILYIGFSSALSGTFSTGALTLEEVAAKYPERKTFAIDSRCASLGEGLLIYKTAQLKKQGKTIEDLAKWVEDNKLHLCHYFTVDDLNHLFRGGRVSKTSAVLGSMLGIKPVLHVDDEGSLVPVSKVRGRKQSLNALVDYMKQRTAGIENDIVFISHGDCEEDAKYIANLVKSELGIKNFIINPIGPTIGTHSGPGCIALFFMGDRR